MDRDGITTYNLINKDILKNRLERYQSFYDPIENDRELAVIKVVLDIIERTPTIQVNIESGEEYDA